MQDSEGKPKKLTEPVKDGPGGNRPTGVGNFEFSNNDKVCCACRSLVFYADRVLPHMGALVCSPCQRQGLEKVVLENDIANKLFEPWDETQVTAITKYQKSEAFMPFICPVGHLLEVHIDGLKCSSCRDFRLRWVYPWVVAGARNSS